MAEIVDNLESSNFKSSLPPRKRAKTKEEKEQRRVERILRNRRAAHASREKKRKHVEYLESYVLKLEDNMSRLQSNFHGVCGQMSAKQLAKIEMKEMDDLQDLKDKIHTNLNGSLLANEGGDDNLDEESTPPAEQPDVKKRKLSSANSCSSLTTDLTESVEEEQVSSDKVNQIPHIKMEPNSDSNELLSITNENVYYNYLSPISINSPINSPIDLTLKKSSENLPPLSLANHDNDIDSLKVYDPMGQNSEEILLPRSYDHQ